MIDALIEFQETTLKTIQGLLRKLLVSGAVDALLVPMTLPAGNVAPMLVTDPNALDRPTRSRRSCPSTPPAPLPT